MRSRCPITYFGAHANNTALGRPLLDSLTVTVCAANSTKRHKPSQSCTMLASFPQKITVPFNLLGDEAKLAFRSQPTGIAKLATTRVCSDCIT